MKVKLPVILSITVLFVIIVTGAVLAGEEIMISEEGLIAWYDQANLKLNDGDNVFVWGDRSVNGNHLQAPDTGNAPVYVENALNEKAAVRFDNNSLQIDFEEAYPQPIVIFILFNAFEETGSVYSNISGGFGNRYRMLLGDPDPGRITIWSGSNWPENIISIGRNFPTGFILANAIHHENEESIMRIGRHINYGQAGISSDRLVELKLGAYGFKGDIVEMIIYNREISEEERKEIEFYFFNKYDL